MHPLPPRPAELYIHLQSRRRCTSARAFLADSPILGIVLGDVGNSAAGLAFPAFRPYSHEFRQSPDFRPPKSAKSADSPQTTTKFTPSRLSACKGHVPPPARETTRRNYPAACRPTLRGISWGSAVLGMLRAPASCAALTTSGIHSLTRCVMRECYYTCASASAFFMHFF